MSDTPRYRRASATGQSVALENSQIKMIFFQRICGWGFGELYTSEGKLMGVLDHFGELMVRDQEIPMRFEGQTYEYRREGDTQLLTFPVATTMAQQKLVGTSFESWVHFPFVEQAMEGTVTFSLKDDENVIRIRYALQSNANLYVRYLRGPWLLVGEGSFGTQKDDALLPGVDWPIGEEWSSGTDFFKDPWANRTIPHMNKVSAPLMAVSHQGDGVGLAWDFNRPMTRWFNYREYYPQPVFAVPNYVERMNNSLMGLMVPDVQEEAQENKPMADVPMELHIGQYVDLEAELFLVKGNSVDVMCDWVKRHGLPEIQNPRWGLEEALDRIANAFNTNLWHEGEGFGIKQREGDKVSPVAPDFLRRYVAEHQGQPIAAELAEKIAWCDAQGVKAHRGNIPEVIRPEEVTDMEELKARGEEILTWQRPDGSFRFEPDGRHYTKDDFRVARSFIEPMGLDQDTALHICTVPAFELLMIYRACGEEKFAAAAKRALDFCLPMTRPEAGDYWETPLHAPNLLAAGHAANTYYVAYQLLGEETYKERAVYWLRCLLPFTHLWEPRNLPMLYDTKPCLCSSDWYFANWVRDHVQWEVLTSLVASTQLGIVWSKVDPEIDWERYQLGVTCAAFHWMVDHRTLTWRPHNIPSSYEKYLRGDFDCCYADTHNTMTGNLGGMCIPPVDVASNIYRLLDQRKE